MAEKSGLSVVGGKTKANSSARDVRLALFQENFTVGDIAGNTAKIIDCMKRARAMGADLVVFPELAISGYPPEDLVLKPDFMEKVEAALDEICSFCKEETIVLGHPLREGGRLYNAASVINFGELRFVYKKRSLPNYGVFDERRYFSPDSEIFTFKLGEVVFGVNICEDIWVSPGATEELCERGARCVVNISASPYHHGKLSERVSMLKKRSSDNGALIVYLNMVGGQDELVFDGGSLIVHGNEILLMGKQFEEQEIYFDLHADIFQTTSPQPRRPSPSTFVFKLADHPSRPEIASVPRDALADDEEIFEALKLGLRDYVWKNGFSKVVLGLSGGIDSALSAAIAADAIGSENVVAVLMPSPYTSEESISLARKLCENLNLKRMEIEISQIFFSYLEALKPVFAGREPDVTEENIQARIRGNLLMALSNKFGWLVLNTGNKSEVSVGYCTLYGDMAGGFSVLKDVYKTMVYRLAEFYNRKHGGDVIPRGIIERAPTAELKIGQKDTDSLPPYAVLDPILNMYIEQDKSVEEIVASGFERELVLRVVKMVDKSEYKRRQSPPGVKITARAFGRDRRYPITNRYTS